MLLRPPWSASTAPCGGALSEPDRNHEPDRTPQPDRTHEPDRSHELASVLAAAGFVAPEEETAELLARAGDDQALLQALVERRLTGEPLAWVTGSTTFCDQVIRVDSGVYVPRWHTEQLARRAVALLPPTGTAIDLCTGTGAIASVLSLAAPDARVVASDLSAAAVACARANGVEAYCGDLFVPLPSFLEGSVDLVVAVVPYVPTPALGLLQRDTLTFETTLSYDGGPDGTGVLRRVLYDAPRFLRPGGVLLVELGGEEADALSEDLARLGYAEVALLTDDEGDVRGLEATWST
jgi:release factor glutamine methyltransferase